MVRVSCSSARFTAFVTLQEKNGRQAFFHLRLLILKKILFVSVIGVWIYQGSVSKYFLNIFLALLYFFVQVYRPWYFWRFEKTQPFLAKNTDIFVSNFFFYKGILKNVWFKARIPFCSFSHKLNILGSIVFFKKKSKVWNQNNPLFLKNAHIVHDKIIVKYRDGI